MGDKITLIDINPEADEQLLVSYFEDLTDKTLYPAQDERLMISVINHQSILNKVAFNEALAQMFLRYARGIFLDLFGEFLGCPRLEAQSAVDILQIKLYEPFAVDKTLPKGSQVETKDGEYIFVTDEDLIISAGQLYGTVAITSELAGSALNAYVIGDINTLIQNYEYVESVTNLNGAKGGADAEEDDAYRERLFIAPEKFSTAGTVEGYKYFAMAAHKDIVDVKVLSTTAGRVDIYVLTKDGEASLAILDAVSKKVSADKRRPLTDNVFVHSAIKSDFTLSPKITLTKTVDYQTTVSFIGKAFSQYFTETKSALGKSVIKSDIIALIKGLNGIYDIDVSDDLSGLTADDTKFHNGSIGTLTIVRAE